MAKQTAAAGRFSMRREDATDGGGMDGAKAVMSVECVQEFTYGGQQKDNPQAAIRVVYEVKGQQKPWEEHFTFGPSDRYEVVEEGASIKPLGKTQGINRKSGAYFFMDAVQDAIEKSKLDIDELLPNITVDGMTLTSLAVLDGQTVILGAKAFVKFDGDSKDRYVPVSFAEAEAAPKRGNGSFKTSTTTGKTTRTAPAEEAEVDSIDEATEATIIKVLGSSKKPVKLQDLSGLVYQADRANPVIKQCMKLAGSAVWVGSEDRPWTLDKKKQTVSL